MRGEAVEICRNCRHEIWQYTINRKGHPKGTWRHMYHNKDGKCMRMNGRCPCKEAKP